MPIYEGQFFNTEEELTAYLTKQRLEAAPHIPTLTETVETYLKTVTPAPESATLSPIERLGLALWNRVSAFFVMMWDNVWSSFRKTLAFILDDLITLFWHTIVTSATPGIKEFLVDRVDDLSLPQEQQGILKAFIDRGTPLDYAVVYLYEILMTVLSILYGVKGAMALVQYKSNAYVMPEPPPINILMDTLHRRPELESTIDDYLAEHGFNSDVREYFKLCEKILLNPDQLKALYLRGMIDKSTKDKLLRFLGYEDDEIEKMESLYDLIPGLGDLISVAERRAFDDAFASKWGADSELPDPVVEEGVKTGQSEKWIRTAWRGHWSLPSVGDGFEMLHRGIITRDDLSDLIKALNIMPVWREKLLTLSFNPYTRIDVRRMYIAGILDKDAVLRTYLDLGYDEEHARNLTAYVVRDKASPQKDLTKSDILEAYARKIITRDAATADIISLGYDALETNVFLAKVDYDVYKKVKDQKIKSVYVRYAKSLITYATARNELASLDMTGNEIDDLFAEWDVEVESRLAELSLTQLQQLYIKKVIDEPTLRKELGYKKYSVTYINWLVELTKKGVVQGA